MQAYITHLIVLAAAAYLAVRFYRLRARKQSTGCGACSSCAGTQTAPTGQTDPSGLIQLQVSGPVADDTLTGVRS